MERSEEKVWDEMTTQNADHGPSIKFSISFLEIVPQDKKELIKLYKHFCFRSFN